MSGIIAGTVDTVAPLAQNRSIWTDNHGPNRIGSFLARLFRLLQRQLQVRTISFQALPSFFIEEIHYLYTIRIVEHTNAIASHTHSPTDA